MGCVGCVPPSSCARPPPPPPPRHHANATAPPRLPAALPRPHCRPPTPPLPPSHAPAAALHCCSSGCAPRLPPRPCRPCHRSAHHVHPYVEVDERRHDGRGAEAQRVGELITHAELLRARKGIQAGDGRSDRKAEVELAEVAALVDEGVGVLLQAEVSAARHSRSGQARVLLCGGRLARRRGGGLAHLSNEPVRFMIPKRL